jgi:hypothetical protein
VEFSPGGYLAFRPGELLVRSAVAEAAQTRLAELHGDEPIEYRELLGGTWVSFFGVPRVLEALGELRGAGIFAQPNHVLFAACCCPPHPSRSGEDGVDAYPFLASSFAANPFLASSVMANPFLASPFLASPFLASGAAGGCCGCGDGAGLMAAPFLASANPSPAAAPWFRETGRRRSTAVPAQPADVEQYESQPGDGVRIAILDTGTAGVDAPAALANMNLNPEVGGDRPDGDGDNYLDPVAGHGTFIAGIIEQLTPGCEFEIHDVLGGYGDGYESEIAETLAGLASAPPEERPHFVNLSFGSYSPIGMEVLADAVAALHRVGVVVVASAGNDATCVPTYPAALPDVVSVGALDPDDRPAAYTNFGPWVRACTRGTDVVGLFFDGFNGAEPPVDGRDADHFRGLARWSGTSFAAPRVVAALAREVKPGVSPRDAVRKLIDDEDLPRRWMLGTVVLPDNEGAEPQA